MSSLIYFRIRMHLTCLLCRISIYSCATLHCSKIDFIYHEEWRQSVAARTPLSSALDSGEWSALLWTTLLPATEPKVPIEYRVEWVPELWPQPQQWRGEKSLSLSGVKFSPPVRSPVTILTELSLFHNPNPDINHLAVELDIYSLAHHLCKMGIFYEPRRVILGNTRHFVGE